MPEFALRRSGWSGSQKRPRHPEEKDSAQEGADRQLRQRIMTRFNLQRPRQHPAYDKATGKSADVCGVVNASMSKSIQQVVDDEYGRTLAVQYRNTDGDSSLGIYYERHEPS